MKRRPRLGLLGVAAALLTSQAGCGDVQPNPSSASGRPAAVADPVNPPVAADLPFDAPGADLVSVMARDDPVYVIVGTAWTGEIRAAAGEAGLRAEVFDPASSVAIEGSLGTALDIVRQFPVTAVNLRESDAAMRPIPDARPVVNVPGPGRPYAFAGFATDLRAVAISSPQRDRLLRSLAELAQTVDGHPYARIDLSGGCEADKAGPVCRLTLVGWSSGSGDHEDDMSIVGQAATGFVGAVEPASVMRTSVSWPIVRFAEWTARHDDAALAKIRTYSSCCIPAWDPLRPGVVSIRYERPCKQAAAPRDRGLADTGECVDALTISVDVGSGGIVAIDERSGP
jgi:hypothetical protein